jgi:hypothetical protein
VQGGQEDFAFDAYIGPRAIILHRADQFFRVIWIGLGQLGIIQNPSAVIGAFMQTISPELIGDFFNRGLSARDGAA